MLFSLSQKALAGLKPETVSRWRLYDAKGEVSLDRLGPLRAAADLLMKAMFKTGCNQCGPAR